MSLKLKGEEEILYEGEGLPSLPAQLGIGNSNPPLEEYLGSIHSRTSFLAGHSD